MQSYQQFIEGSDDISVDDFNPMVWNPTVWIGKPGPTRLHAWSAYPNQRAGYAERVYHGSRTQEYVSREAAIQWWNEVGNQSGDIRAAVNTARAIVAGKNTDVDDFRLMLKVQRKRYEDDPEFRTALATWTEGHIVEKAPASAVDKRWGVDATNTGRNLLGIVLMRIARENGIGPVQTDAPDTPEASTNAVESPEGDVVLPF